MQNKQLNVLRNLGKYLYDSFALRKSLMKYSVSYQLLYFPCFEFNLLYKHFIFSHYIYCDQCIWIYVITFDRLETVKFRSQ